MRYYFTEQGLEPITCSTEALFESLCTDLSTNKYKSAAFDVVESLLNDDSTVFRKHTDTPTDIDLVIHKLGRILLKATLPFDGYRPQREEAHGRIINRIEYQRGYQGYSADLWMIEKSFLHTEARKAIIDNILDSI